MMSDPQGSGSSMQDQATDHPKVSGGLLSAVVAGGLLGCGTSGLTYVIS